MTKRTRAALERAHQLAQDLALDTEIHSAARPLRVTPTDLTHFDTQYPSVPTALAPRQAHRVQRLLRVAASGDAAWPEGETGAVRMYSTRAPSSLNVAASTGWEP